MTTDWDRADQLIHAIDAHYAHHPEVWAGLDAIPRALREEAAHFRYDQLLPQLTGEVGPTCYRDRDGRCVAGEIVRHACYDLIDRSRVAPSRDVLIAPQLMRLPMPYHAANFLIDHGAVPRGDGSAHEALHDAFRALAAVNDDGLLVTPEAVRYALGLTREEARSCA